MARAALADRIRKEVDIVEIIGRTVPVARHGRSHRGLCFFCDGDGQSETLVIHRQEGFFHCSGCNREGDVIDWLMQVEKMSRRDAAAALADILH